MNSLVAPPGRLQEISRSLGDIAGLWLDPRSDVRLEAISALGVSTSFTAAMIAAALDAAFTELTTDKLQAFTALEPAFQSYQPEHKVLHILAGNVFTAWLPGACTTLLLGADCALKPSSQEPVFAGLWKRSVETVDPDLGRRIEIVSWNDDLLSRYNAIVAYGSDTTLQKLRAKTPPGVRFVGYGHKISVAIIFREAIRGIKSGALLEQIRRDVEPFQLQGCLSPQVIYLEEGDPRVLDPLRSSVAVMPRVKRFNHWDEIWSELCGLQPHLSGFGYAGPEARVESIRSKLNELGFTRICRLGEMQQPPLSWRNGGFSLAEALTR